MVDGHTEPRGIPAFIKPLAKLKQLGHQVDFIILTTDAEKISLAEHPLFEGSEIAFVKWSSKGLQRLISPLRALQEITEKLDTTSYDFVYGHGPSGSLGCYVARKRGIPTGLRLYGVSWLSEQIKERSKLRLLMEHPLLVYSFLGKKTFLIVTDDGSRGDLVHQRLQEDQKSYRFYFWRNGMIPLESNPPAEGRVEPVLLYPGRIAKKKGQLMAVEVLAELHRAGLTKVKLLCCGHATEAPYVDQLNNRLKEEGLESSYEYLGVIPKEELAERFRGSLAVLSFQKISNRSNVAIEALSNGSCFVTLNDGSFDGILEHEKSAFLVNSAKEAADAISRIVIDSDFQSELRLNARQAVKKAFTTWDKRVQTEIDLILNECKSSRREPMSARL